MLNDSHLTHLWCADMWHRKFGIDIRGHFAIAHEATTESRLRILHFKILHNIYPTNILLHKMKLKTNDKCEECQTTDYMEHFFFQCKKLNGFWQYVSTTIYKTTHCKIQLSETTALFGIAKPNYPLLSTKQLNKINHILLIAKMCISKIRYGKSKNPFITLDMELSIRRANQ